jgi:hypothetical protein
VPKFRALVQFSHEFSEGQKMFNPTLDSHEVEDEALVKEWEKAGYVVIGKAAVKIDKNGK